jgi:hypothetical protein
MKMKHAFVIGGSGMLSKASLWLAANGYIVSVLGRNTEKLKRLTDASDNVIPISADYNNELKFRAAIHKSVITLGRYDLVVSWIHSNTKKIIDVISSEIQLISDESWSLYHILGSSEDLKETKLEMIGINNCNYHQIQLGFIVENNKSRWLTHDEISNGVINSIETLSEYYLIGTLTPWDKRP